MGPRWVPSASIRRNYKLDPVKELAVLERHLLEYQRQNDAKGAARVAREMLVVRRKIQRKGIVQ